MVLVYALKNTFNQEIYIGISKDINHRLNEHNSGKNRYTKAFMPWSIIYTESCSDYQTARLREKYLKSAAGKRFLKKFYLNPLNAGSQPIDR